MMTTIRGAIRWAIRWAGAGGMALVALTAAGTTRPAEGQDAGARWQRSSPPTVPPVTVFHSTQSANLPTAETLGRGEFLFEISHRFEPAISRGGDALWGFDGPVNNRLGLAWAATDHVMLGIIRSSEDDNLEVNAKARVAELRGPVPLVVGAMGGLAFNTQPDGSAGFEDNERQAYVQLIVDAALGTRLAVGVVPGVLTNARVEEASSHTAFVLGVHGQWFLSEHASLLAEWIATEAREDFRHDAATFGIDLETGGHFFKIVVTNQVRMNATQHLAGAPFPVTLDAMRIGFNITRVLAF